MNDQINEIILEELRGLRTEVTNGFSETKQRLTAVEVTIKPFFEQDGEKQRMQDDITDLQKTKWYGIGFVGAVSLLGHYIAHKFFRL